MNKISKKLTIIFLAVTLAILPTVSVQASEKTDVQKVLDYYKKGQISKAKTYNKKLSKNASRASIKKLSKKEKAAYQKAVKKYKVSIEPLSNGEYLWGYFLADLDGDKKAELLVQHGTCEADTKVTIYTYKKGKLKKIGDEYCAHTCFYGYPGHTGVICVMGHQGVEGVSTMYVKSGKIKTKSYGGRELKANEKYFPFRQALDSHIKYGKNGKRSVDWKDLK